VLSLIKLCKKQKGRKAVADYYFLFNECRPRARGSRSNVAVEFLWAFGVSGLPVSRPALCGAQTKGQILSMLGPGPGSPKGGYE
jgi:hypothetical protein